jgi:uncharacterized membrane protein
VMLSGCGSSEIPESNPIEQGALTINATPSSAKLMLSSGTGPDTPLEAGKAAKLAVGSYTLTATAEGYNSYSQKLEVKAKDSVVLEAKLSKIIEKGSVFLNFSPANAVVTVIDADGLETGVALGKTVSLPVGNYTLLAKADGYTSYTQKLEVKARDSVVLEGKLSKIIVKGTILFDVTPNTALVTMTDMDGLEASFQVGKVQSMPVGRYAVRIKAAGYEDLTESIEITSGSFLFQKNLKKMETPLEYGVLRVLVDPARAELSVTDGQGKETPLEVDQVSKLPVGNYTLLARMAGYQNLIQKVQIKAQDSQVLELKMVKIETPAPLPVQKGSLTVTVNPSSALVTVTDVNGVETLLETARVKSLVAGSYTLVAQALGFETLIQKVEIKAQDSQILELKLVKVVP